MPELYPEDQERVDRVLSEGIYKVDRKPFRFWLLFWSLVGLLGVIFFIAVGLANYFDHY